MPGCSYGVVACKSNRLSLAFFQCLPKNLYAGHSQLEFTRIAFVPRCGYWLGRRWEGRTILVLKDPGGEPLDLVLEREQAQPEERQEVSARMKNYWVSRRQAQERTGC